MRQNRLAGHGLQAEGAAFDIHGNRVRWNSVAGEGFARCSCGESSERSFGSARERRQWHRDHKNDLKVQAYLASGEAS